MIERPRFRVIVWAVGLCSAAACTPQPQTIAFRSLESSGTAAFLCLAERDGDTKFRGAREIKDCPDTSPVDGEFRQTFALVTQADRGEVAVLEVNATDSASGKIVSGVVLDEEPSVPGYNFLPVGAQPVDIVATPGSKATFVAAAEPGKEGIYALPTGCVLPRDQTLKEPVRDITVWPACHLPSAPGKMTILVDPSDRADCRTAKPPSAEGGAGDGGPVLPVDAGGNRESDAALESDCRADLTTELGPAGRRKLVVSLPDEGQLVVIDAQAILDRKPGSFDMCPIEETATLELKHAITPLEPIIQKLPPDLDNAQPAGIQYPAPPPEGYKPRPAGFARFDDSNEHRLYVADLQAPMIHVLDTADPCRIVEQPPLLPVSYFDRNRVITTSRVAVMDRLTRDGKRYLYAIDQVGLGQVMIFDVSPDATARTPIVRERSPLMPAEAPDRLAISAPAVDVGFITMDRSRAPNSATGTEVPTLCDPLPGSTSPGTVYQPTLPDYATGANPRLLRGTFGLIALTSGHLAVIDVEDLDAPCRRPKLPNHDKDDDFRGCSGDPASVKVAYTKDGTLDGTPTVTEEASCRVVERHRARSQDLVLTTTSLGARAPAIRVLPKLVDASGRGLATDDTDEGRKNPKMLGVNFRGFDAATRPQNHAQVYVSTELFEVDPTPDAKDHTPPAHTLDIDPATTKQNSVVLNLEEPRAYLGDESFSATYEGRLFDDRPAGVFRFETRDNGTVFTVRDSGFPGGFCSAGIESSTVAGQRATLRASDAKKDIGVTDVDAFKRQYADYVVITGDLLPDTDAYWQPGKTGASCLKNPDEPDQPGAGFVRCRVQFGTAQTPNPSRYLSIIEASRDRLTLQPRPDNGAADPALLKAVECCFPEPVSYTVRVSHEWLVRGSNVQHNILTGPSPDFNCVPDPNPLFEHLKSRAFEVACDEANSQACYQPPPEDPKAPPTSRIIGPVKYGDNDPSPALACIVKNPRTELKTIDVGPNAGCIFTGLQNDFVIYRGTNPSLQDMQFQWQVTGSFAPLAVNMSVSNDANTSPQSLMKSPFNGTVIVADAGTKGLVIVDLTSFSPYSIY